MKCARGMLVWAWVVLAGSTFWGCEGDDGVAPPPSLVEQGWNAFESGDFASAASRFQAEINGNPGNARAHNGLGWANAKLGNLSAAITNFSQALSKGFRGVDPHAGQALVYRDLEPVDYALAIAAANAALAADPDYQFAHDPALDYLDLHLVLAQSHFALGDYAAANAEVAVLGGNVQDPQSATFVEDLLAEIERLGQVVGG
jgi:tetratricopeptide (TPR) repeat protein